MRRGGPGHGAVARATVAGVLVGMWLASCAFRPPQTAPDTGRDLKQEVTALWTQIRDWRFEAGMNVEPEHETKMAMRGQTVATAMGACPTDPAPASERCADVCDLADAICDNADRICAIADELRGDPWAVDKCTSATASCREAKQRCCTCDTSPDPHALFPGRDTGDDDLDSDSDASARTGGGANSVRP